MKSSKISFKTLLIILFIAALAITYFNVEKNKKLKSSNVITNINTPLGQASVVDNISDPNISSQRFTNLIGRRTRFDLLGCNSSSFNSLFFIFSLSSTQNISN